MGFFAGKVVESSGVPLTEVDFKSDLKGLSLPEEYLAVVPPIPLIRELVKWQVPVTPEVLEWCWCQEEIIQRITKLAIDQIIGAGWVVEDAEGDLGLEVSSIFEDGVFPMEDFVEVSLMNLVIYGNQLWVPKFEDDVFVRLDPVDWKTVTHYRDPISGREVFIQKVLVPEHLVREVDGVVQGISEEEWKEISADEFPAVMARTRYVVFKLFDDEVLYLKVGARGAVDGVPLMASVVNDIVAKKRLEIFMIKAGELWGSPILKGKLFEDLAPEQLTALFRRPEALADIQKQVEEFADTLSKYRQFGVFALAPHQSLDIISPQRRVFDYPDLFNYLNQEIVGCLLGSVALFEARGSELATSRTIKSVWDHTVDGWRIRFEGCLNRQFIPMVKRVGKLDGHARIRFRRLEVPEEVILRFMALPREERRRLERLWRGEEE